MSKTKTAAHTPGPLTVGTYYPTDAFRAVSPTVCVSREDGTVVAVTGPELGPTSRADAILFAAAPDMLHALQMAKACGSQGETHEGWSVSTFIEDAIKKATGEAPISGR